jgi:hypothetical protein
MTGLAWRAAQIPAQIEQAFTDAIDPETGEIVNESALERVNALAHEKTVAIEDLAYFVKELQTVKIAHLDAIIKELATKKARLQKASDICEAVISDLLPVGEKLETDFVKVKWHPSEAVMVDCAPELLPEKFQRIKTTCDPDKKALKDALKAGETIEGARIEKRFGLVIK